MGELLLALGENDRARTAFDQELALDPDDFVSNLNLGVLAKQDQDYAEARRYFERALKARPNDPGVRYQIANVDLATGNPDEARKALEALIAESPDFAEAHATLATVYYRLDRSADGERERAIAQEAHRTSGTRRRREPNRDEAVAGGGRLWLAAAAVWVAGGARRPNRGGRISPISRPNPTSPTAPITTSPAGNIFRRPCAAAWPPSISTTTAAWTSSSPTAPSCPNCEKTDPRFYNCLLRNRGDGTFEDVTARAGLPGKDLGFSFGVAAGDYDNDGFEDLFICNAGRNALYHNNGDGTFTDVTERSGIGASRRTCSASPPPGSTTTTTASSI